MGSQIEFDPARDNVTIINGTDFDDRAIAGGLEMASHPLMAAMVRWTRDVQRTRRGGFADRDKYLAPRDTFDQIRTARTAMGDDVVEGVADTTESLVFSETAMFAEDVDEQDVWNQWAADIDLDNRLREIWRTLMSDSQVVVGMLWGKETYRVRGLTESGNPKRKTFDVNVPLEVSLLDSLKVMPVGTLLFNRERLAYVATPLEAAQFDEILARKTEAGLLNLDPDGLSLFADDIVGALVERRYHPDVYERAELSKEHVDTSNLFLLKQDAVFRHTLTRPAYKRFADVRMRSVFELLDMKQQLRQMDRVFLIGGTSFLLVVKKGTDALPAEQDELTALQANVQVIARVPIIVSDHRLSVEIVTPKLEFVLDRKRYDTLDVRIAARLFQTFVPTGADDRDPLKLGRVIAQGLQSRRQMIRRSLEAKVFKAMVKRNEAFTDKPKLLFRPAQISLTFDSAWATFMLDLRAANELSRDTMLSQFGLDQLDEARLRKREAEELDAVFMTQQPYSPPNPALPPGGPGADPQFKPQEPFKPPAPADPMRPGRPDKLAKFASPGPQADPGPGDQPVTAPPVPAAPAKPAPKATKRAAGRRGGGTRGGGGAAPGKGQGQAPRRGVPKASEEGEGEDE